MQISDFGLAKWLPDQWTHLSVSQFEGTFGFVRHETYLKSDQGFNFVALAINLILVMTATSHLSISCMEL